MNLEMKGYCQNREKGNFSASNTTNANQPPPPQQKNESQSIKMVIPLIFCVDTIDTYNNRIEYSGKWSNLENKSKNKNVNNIEYLYV